jgi:hypothetical protein
MRTANIHCLLHGMCSILRATLIEVRLQNDVLQLHHLVVGKLPALVIMGGGYLRGIQTWNSRLGVQRC